MKTGNNLTRVLQISAVILFTLIACQSYAYIVTPRLPDNIKLECSLPDIPTETTQIVLVKEFYDQHKALDFAKRFAGFSGISRIKGSIHNAYHELFYGLYNLTFYGIGTRHIEFHMPWKERYTVKDRSETDCIQYAEEFVKNVTRYLETDLKLQYQDSVAHNVFDISSDSINYYRVYFRVLYNGVELKGYGSDVWVDVCDRGVLGFRFDLPMLEKRGMDKVYLTPIQALSRIEDRVSVIRVTFCYYHDFIGSENRSEIEYGYYVEGVKDDGEEFSKFIPSTAGSQYREQ